MKVRNAIFFSWECATCYWLINKHKNTAKKGTCSFFFSVLFSYFTSEIKTGMETNTCFIVYFRSVCVDSILFELMLFNLGPYAKKTTFICLFLIWHILGPLKTFISACVGLCVCQIEGERLRERERERERGGQFTC